MTSQASSKTHFNIVIYIMQVVDNTIRSIHESWKNFLLIL